MKLNEVFKDIYPFERAMDGGYFYTAKGDMISVLFETLATDIWAVSFMSGSTFNLTAKGDAFKILSTVIAIVKQWASQAKPKVLTFSSNKEDRNRSKTYASIVKRMVKDTSYIDVSENINAVKNENIRNWLERTKRHHKSSDIFILVRDDQI